MSRGLLLAYAEEQRRKKELLNTRRMMQNASKPLSLPQARFRLTNDAFLPQKVSSTSIRDELKKPVLHVKCKDTSMKRAKAADESTDSTDSSITEDFNGYHLPDLSSQETAERRKSKRYTTSDLVSSPRLKKLKEDISLLRKRSREDGIKIKCLQNKIRRLSRKRGKSKEIAKDGQLNERGLKRRVPFTDDESTEPATSSPASPSRFVDRIIFDGEIDLELKTEPLNENNYGGSSKSSLDQDTGFEEYVIIEEIKAEIEDDPLMPHGGSNE